MKLFCFSKICRLCSGNKNVTLNLNNLDSDNILLLNKLTTIAPTLLNENDTLPLGICTICYVKLNEAYTFVTKCLEVNSKLKYYKDKLLNEDIDIPYDISNIVVELIKNSNNDKVPDKIKFENTEKTVAASANTFDKNAYASNKIKKEYDETTEENKQLNDEIDTNETSIYLKKDVENIVAKTEVEEQLSTCVSAVDNQQRKSKKLGKQLHLNQNSFTCEICGKVIRQKGDFKRHVSTHRGERPFPCSICGKTYTRQSDLNRHIAIHSGQKSFTCEICGKAFSYKFALTIHLRVHSGERPYSCEICGKAFSQCGTLKDHLLIHSGKKAFICEICGKDFCSKKQVRKHYHIHLGQKPFGCEICNKCFMTKAKLRNHLRVHTQEKPFACQTCGKGFVKKIHFKKHLLLHSNENSSKLNV